ncbi:MAG TPA: phosphotransferase [Phycicoccus sp.]|nr:phosphotransferase [Phycicoccus sp.]
MDAEEGRGADAYAALGTEAQVEVLRRVALEAVEEYALPVHRMELVLHGFNTTFRVDAADGRTLALRVNTNSVSTAAHLAAQQAWVHALARDTDVVVPDAVPTPDGRTAVAVPCAETGRDLLVVVNTWLDGPDVGQCDARTARALGRVMAALHEHAEGFALPEGTELPRFDEPLFGDENRLEGAGALGADGRAVVDEAFARARAAFAELYRDAALVALHADLHGGNLKDQGDRLAVFDFDDSGMGVPLLDLAVATFYLRGSDPEVEDALRAGYAEVRPLPTGEEHLEALVASRQLLLANSLLTTSTAQWRARAEEYLGTTVARLEHWMRSGRLVLDPPGS